MQSKQVACNENEVRYTSKKNDSLIYIHTAWFLKEIILWQTIQKSG